MEINNNQSKAFTVIIIIFFLINVIVALLVEQEERIFYYLILGLGMTSVLFRLFGKNKVKKLSFRGDSLDVLFYEKSFALEKRTFELATLSWVHKKELVGQLATAEKLIVELKRGETKLVLSTELLLWSEEQIREIILMLESKGIVVEDTRPH